MLSHWNEWRETIKGWICFIACKAQGLSAEKCWVMSSIKKWKRQYCLSLLCTCNVLAMYMYSLCSLQQPFPSLSTSPFWEAFCVFWAKDSVFCQQPCISGVAGDWQYLRRLVCQRFAYITSKLVVFLPPATMCYLPEVFEGLEHQPRADFS